MSQEGEKRLARRPSCVLSHCRRAGWQGTKLVTQAQRAGDLENHHPSSSSLLLADVEGDHSARSLSMTGSAAGREAARCADASTAAGAVASSRLPQERHGVQVAELVEATQEQEQQFECLSLLAAAAA